MRSLSLAIVVLLAAVANAAYSVDNVGVTEFMDPATGWHQLGVRCDYLSTNGPAHVSWEWKFPAEPVSAYREAGYGFAPTVQQPTRYRIPDYPHPPGYWPAPGTKINIRVKVRPEGVGADAIEIITYTIKL